MTGHLVATIVASVLGRVSSTGTLSIRVRGGRRSRGLSDRFTVIAWDAPGTGQSQDPPALARADTRDLLQTIRVPTLLIWGDADKRSPLNVGQSIRDAIPGAKLEVIPGVGHFSNLERPGEFNAIVRTFCLPLS